MNQLTTIAALPSGAGRAARLPAEVGSTSAPEPVFAVYGIVRTADPAFAQRALMKGYDVKSVSGGWEVTNMASKGD